MLNMSQLDMNFINTAKCYSHTPEAKCWCFSCYLPRIFELVLFFNSRSFTCRSRDSSSRIRTNFLNVSNKSMKSKQALHFMTASFSLCRGSCHRIFFKSIVRIKRFSLRHYYLPLLQGHSFWSLLLRDIRSFYLGFRDKHEKFPLKPPGNLGSLYHCWYDFECPSNKGRKECLVLPPSTVVELPAAWAIATWDLGLLMGPSSQWL